MDDRNTKSGDDDNLKGLSSSNRRVAITEAVMATGTVRIEELSDRFAVSRMTIHRDIEALKERGVLRRTRGTVTAVASSLFEASLEYMSRQQLAEKASIAACAAELVQPGDAVILDDSTTGLSIANRLVKCQPLTVISNFERVLNLLKTKPPIKLISTGGEYSQLCDAYIGTVTLNTLRNLAADIYFMSAAAIVGDVCYHPEQDIVLVKQAMLRAARKKILVVDHSKFARRSLHAIASIQDLDMVIVDSNIDSQDVQRLRQTGVEVRLTDT